MAQYWWESDAEERYWLEYTDRTDLGTDLRAPTLDQSGTDNWRYTLFQMTTPGDVIFHYHKPQHAIVAVSRVADGWKSRPIIWGARGTFARAKNIRPHERPGYVVPLEGYQLLDSPIRLAELREKKPLLQSLQESARTLYPGRSLYFPFELAQRPVRPLQGYAFKLSREFVRAFGLPEFEALSAEVPAVSNAHSGLRREAQGYAVSIEVRRAVERRAMALALRHYRSQGFKVENCSRTHPYDIVARSGSRSWTVEVKGTTGLGDAVFLTRNEVEHATQHPKNAVLFVVHSMDLVRGATSVRATGGLVRIFEPWQVGQGDLEALQFRYLLPHSDGESSTND